MRNSRRVRVLNSYTNPSFYLFHFTVQSIFPLRRLGPIFVPWFPPCQGLKAIEFLRNQNALFTCHPVNRCNINLAMQSFLGKRIVKKTLLKLSFVIKKKNWIENKSQPFQMKKTRVWRKLCIRRTKQVVFNKQCTSLLIITRRNADTQRPCSNLHFARNCTLVPSCTVAASSLCVLRPPYRRFSTHYQELHTSRYIFRLCASICGTLQQPLLSLHSLCFSVALKSGFLSLKLPPTITLFIKFIQSPVGWVACKIFALSVKLTHNWDVLSIRV